jgi:glycosyltransferase involved in cell wall biosynthesis
MGVDVARVKTEVGQRRPEPGRLLFVGRLVDKKGVDVLLRALALLPDPVHLVIVGDGPLRRDLDELATSLGVAGRAEFLGKQTRQEVMAQFARAAVVVLPSQVGGGGDQDGVPVVLAEAIAAGVPVVASRLGGIAEHLADGTTAWLAAPGVPESLAGALKAALDDPAHAAAVSGAATESALPQLSVGHTADVYLDLLARGSHP